MIDATSELTETNLYADDALLHMNFSQALPLASQLEVFQQPIDTAKEWATSLGGRFGHNKTSQLAVSLEPGAPHLCKQPLCIEGGSGIMHSAANSNVKMVKLSR